MTQFYTYLHCKPDGTPFYVGKGHGDRAYNLISGRKNIHHRSVVLKYGKENILIYTFLCVSEEQALSDEIQQIAQLRKEGHRLCNRTNGGDGVMKGMKHSDEARKKISLNSNGRKKMIDLSGHVFGSWTVIGFHETRILESGVRKPLWMCVCKCGTQRSVEGGSLKSGSSVGCGCTKKIAISNAQKGTKKGIKLSPDHCKKISLALIGNRYRANFLRGNA